MTFGKLYILSKIGIPKVKKEASLMHGYLHEYSLVKQRGETGQKYPL